MWNFLKEYLSDLFLIALSGIFIGHFVYFLVIGRPITVYENKTWITIGEILLLSGIFILAIERLVKDIKHAAENRPRTY